MPIIRLSDHQNSQRWLAQFTSPEDRALAAQLLNHLTLVSAREFESSIEKRLIDLQEKLGETIAVYPIVSPMADGISGHDQFAGSIPKDASAKARDVGRRKQYGSEDRVGHMLTKLSIRFRRGSGSSPIEVNPTITQLKTQGIKHIVLVDDICGSGKRVIDYWKKVPRGIKSLLSFGRCNLWIVLYAIAPKGRASIKRHLSNFPIKNLSVELPMVRIDRLLPPGVVEVCVKYAKQAGIRSTGLGYRGSACGVIFEHGCPNNVPEILWAKTKYWSPLFKNCSIPTEMRDCFDGGGETLGIEALWRVNQKKLALQLIDSLDGMAPITTEQRMLLTILGMRMIGVPQSDLSARLTIGIGRIFAALKRAEGMGMYVLAEARVTPLGEEVVSRFRERYGQRKLQGPIGFRLEDYYPSQCEGELL